jgi:drug/metabolite transporter (DMT)-like permease
MFEYGFLFAFLSMLFWGIGDSLFNSISKNNKEEVILFFQNLFFGIISIFLLVYLFIFDLDFTKINYDKIYFPILTILFEILGVLFLIKSLKKEKLGLSIAIASSYPLIVFLFSYFFLNETISLLSIFLIFLVIISLFLISLETINLKKLKSNKNLKYPFLSFLSWGLSEIFTKYTSNYYTDEISTSFIFFFSFLIMFLYFLFFSNFKKLKNISKNSLLIIFSISSFLFLANYFIISAYKLISTSLASAIAGSSSLISILIGIIFFKERFKKFQYFGMFILIVSLFFLVYLN